MNNHIVNVYTYIDEQQTIIMSKTNEKKKVHLKITIIGNSITYKSSILMFMTHITESHMQKA